MLAASLQAFLSSTPQSVKDFSLVFLLFFVVDFLSGVANAAVGGKLSSSEARRKLLAKSVQYLGILTLGAGGTIVTDSWNWIVTSIASTCAMEAISIVENIRGLQKSGINLGPVSPLLDRIAKLFGDLPPATPPPPEESCGRPQTRKSDDPSL